MRLALNHFKVRGVRRVVLTLARGSVHEQQPAMDVEKEKENGS
jgi:hypothetical protein